MANSTLQSFNLAQVSQSAGLPAGRGEHSHRLHRQMLHGWMCGSRLVTWRGDGADRTSMRFVGNDLLLRLPRRSCRGGTIGPGRWWRLGGHKEPNRFRRIRGSANEPRWVMFLTKVAPSTAQ